MRLEHWEGLEVRDIERLKGGGEAHHALSVVTAHLGAVPPLVAPAGLADVVDAQISVAHDRDPVLVRPVGVIQISIEVNDDPPAGVVVELPVVAQPHPIERPVPDGHLLGGRDGLTEVVAPDDDLLQIRVVVEGVQEIELVVQSDLLGLHDTLSPLSILRTRLASQIDDLEGGCVLCAPGNANGGDENLVVVRGLRRLRDALIRIPLDGPYVGDTDGPSIVHADEYGVVTVTVSTTRVEGVVPLRVVL